MEGTVQLAVTVEDDPGRDLGEDRQMGHRFFFAPDEVEPLDGAEPRGGAAAHPRGRIGNVFLGDDGFGVEVAGRLARSKLPAGVVVQDFGIRGMDLAYALARLRRGRASSTRCRAAARPGTLYLIEPELDDEERGARRARHGPGHACWRSRASWAIRCRGCWWWAASRRRCLRCEDDVVAELSAPVRAVIDDAVRMVERLLDDLLQTSRKGAGDMKKRGVAAAAFVAATGAAVAAQWPEIQRY